MDTRPTNAVHIVGLVSQSQGRDMPSVVLSVVMPNYNHARYLPRALGAILSQSLPPDEIVIVDDASTDDSVAVIESFAYEQPRIRLVRNESNLGVVGAMNRGAALATGRYLAFAAADDYALPGFFEKAVALFDRHPKAGLCFGYDTCQFGDDGAIVPNPSGWPDQPDYYPPEEVCRHLRHTIAGHCGLFRADALRDIGWYDAGLAWYCDWFAHLTLAFRHGACHIPEPLAVRVLLPQNYSAEAKPGAKNVAVLRAFFDRITSPAYADVAPYFRRNGAATYFGTDLIRAAATRPDCWQPHVLGFLNGFTDEQYAGLLNDPEPRVREVAALFLGPYWRQAAAKRQEIEAELQQLRDDLEVARGHIPPPGAMGKARWLAGMMARRLKLKAG